MVYRFHGGVRKRYNERNKERTPQTIRIPSQDLSDPQANKTMVKIKNCNLDDKLIWTYVSMEGVMGKGWIGG